MSANIVSTSTPVEVRFTAKRACRWTGQRWVTISQDTARGLIALGAADLTDTEWIGRGSSWRDGR